ncbi:TPA: hypothetical protein U2E57_000093 [Streptococcus suis]|nr:hypothetical protein [Streptococcus suis]
MKTILRYFWYQEKYNLYRTVNGFFYYLRKLPLVGKSIPESIFKSYSFKSGLFLILHVLSIPSRFLVKGIWLTIYSCIATFWIKLLSNNQLDFWQIPSDTWLLGFSMWMVFVGYTYRFGKGFEPFIAKSEREFMRNFGLSQSSFLQSQLFVEPTITSLAYLPALLIFSSLSGMTYLNALLFDRYRSVLTKKLHFRLGCLLAIVLFIEGIRWFSKDDIQISNTNYIEGLPFAFMVMYAASMGKAVAQMVFVNCDISMLHYPFYREAKTIIAGFHYRFLQTVKLNVAFSGSLLLALIIFTRAQLPIETYLLTALLLLSLTALFSFHDLFIYYILQPFTKDMEVVNPVYKFLSGALYWVAYLNIKLDLGSHLYILLISIAMITYVSIGYWILLKKAPQTFRLKS